MINFFLYLIAVLLIPIMKLITKRGVATDECLKNKFLLVPVHFYSTIPDIFEMEKRNIWDRKSKLNGINLNTEKQLNLLQQLGASYNNECNWPKTNIGDEKSYYTKNDSFGGGCAVAAHSIIRKYKPKNIIEIGTGRSSLIIRNAIELNKKENKECNYTIIDPYPNFKIIDKTTPDQLIQKQAELMDEKFFSVLKENDVLFIDSSHVSKLGSDVNFLYLEILPMLNPGVIVHIHDIRLPYEYTKRFSFKGFPKFYNEQYLLQAFLSHNYKYEILLALNYLMVDYKEKFKAAFNKCELGHHPSSFWIKKHS